MRYCKKCVMPDTRPGMKFDEEGICSGCRVASQVVQVDGMRLFSLGSALIYCSPTFFRDHPTDARAAIALIDDSSELLPIL